MRRQFPNALIKLRSPIIFINGDEACEVCLGEGKSRKVKGGSSSDRFVDKIGINNADSDRLVYRRLKKDTIRNIFHYSLIFSLSSAISFLTSLTRSIILSLES